MAPQSERHQIAVSNLMACLRRLAADRGCRALPGLGLLNDAIDDYARDPVLIAEVLSPSTMSNDRGRKLDFHRTIPSLRTILIAYQSEARVEASQREGEEWRWTVFKELGAVLPLPELGDTISLFDLYEGIGPLA